MHTLRQENNNYWIIIPPHIAGLDDLPNGAKLVFGRIFALVQRSGYCWAFNEHLSQGIGLTKNTTSEYVRLLAKRGFITVELKRDEKQEVIERKIFITLPNQDLVPSPTGIGDLPNQDLNIVNNISNNNKNKEKTLSSSIGISPSSPKSSKNAVVPLTDLERWELAKDVDVPLHIVKRTEKNFWEYIEDPKKNKYKTSYKTIKKWIEMGIERGAIQNCSETEKLQLDLMHPDKLKEANDLFNWAKEEKLTE